MKIQVVNNALQSSQKHNNVTMPKSNIGLYISQKQPTTNVVAFKGMRTLLKNIFSPQKVETEADALRELSKKDFGCFVKIKNQFVPLSPKKVRNFNNPEASEIIIKKGERTTIVSGDKSDEIHKTRYGITPVTLLGALKGGYSKLTVIANNSFHVVSLPSTPSERAAAYLRIEKVSKPFVKTEDEIINIVPEAQSEFLYKQTKQMINKSGAKGIRLETKPFVKGSLLVEA